MSGAPSVHGKQQNQNGRVYQGKAALERNRKRVDRGHGQIENLHVLCRLEDNGLLSFGQDKKGQDHRPTQADQQPVGTSHVGYGIMLVFRIVGRLPGKYKVNRILWKNSDESQDGDSQRFRDVNLGRFGRP